MNAFEEAWGVIKALEEQQGFTMSPFTPTEYGQENPSMQRRAGTIHPAILGMMERRQKKPYEWEIASGRPFPDKRIAAEGVGGDYGDIGPFGTMVNQKIGTSKVFDDERMNAMTGQLREDELTDAGQRKRGSVFDAGHYNKFGLPMVGVRQPIYRERRKPRYPNSNPEFQPDSVY